MMHSNAKTLNVDKTEVRSEISKAMETDTMMHINVELPLKGTDV